MHREYHQYTFTQHPITMEIRQLKYFIAIAENGSFSEASRRCNLSQSAISQQIKALEDELDTRLLERSAHHVTLTESGEHLLPLARQVVEDAQRCSERMADVKGMLCGDLRIGLTYTMEPYVRKTVVRFMKLHPQVRLHIHYATIAELIPLLRGGKLDMAFSIRVKGEDDWVDSIQVSQVEMCAVMRKTHPLASREVLSFEELRLQHFILPEPAVADSNPVHRYLSQHAEGLRVRATINDVCALLQLLKYTNCISVLSRRMVQNIDELCAIPIRELSHPIPMYIHYLQGAYRKRSSQVFQEMLQQIIAQDTLLSNC